MYAKPVDLNDFSVEFTVTKKAGDYNLQNTGVDSWISLCLLNKKDKYFNVNKAGQSQGIVTLIRPMGSTTAFEINQLTNSWSTASRRSYPYEGAMNTTFKVEIKKGPLTGTTPMTSLSTDRRWISRWMRVHRSSPPLSS